MIRPDLSQLVKGFEFCGWRGQIFTILARKICRR